MSALDLQVPQGGPHPWEDELSNFVEKPRHLSALGGDTAQQLLALFDTPENLRIQGSEMFYYCACAELLSATRLYSEAGEHIALIAGLFGLLKAEGLQRDDPEDPDGTQTFMNVLVSPTVRQLADATAVPPGYKHNRGAFALEQDPEYVKGDSFQADLAEYARKHEGQLRFWSLVGRLDADGLLGSDAPGVGAMPLLFHQGPQLLRALEDPASRDVWERYGRRCCTATRRWHMGSGVAIGWSGLLGSRMRRGRLRGMRGCPCCGVVALRLCWRGSRRKD
ncbi:hypothetical protein B0H14DRAFT_2740596, partial [Mycena olivaceomarginata]